jgi:hypothetical protein
VERVCFGQADSDQIHNHINKIPAVAGLKTSEWMHAEVFVVKKPN